MGQQLIDLRKIRECNSRNIVSDIFSYLPKDHKTFLEILKIFWLKENVEYSLYFDIWHTFDSWDTWEYEEYSFKVTKEWYSFTLESREAYEKCPQTLSYEDQIVSLIKDFEDNDKLFTSKRIRFENWKFFLYEVNKDLLKDLEKIGELYYGRKYGKVTFNPRTKEFIKYERFGDDLTEIFNKNLDEIISIIDKSKSKSGLLKRIRIKFPTLIEYIQLKNWELKLKERVHKYISQDRIRWTRKFYLWDYVYFREEINEKRRPFTVEELLRERYNNIYFNQSDLCEIDKESLYEAIDNKWYCLNKNVFLLDDEYKEKNNLNKEKEVISHFNSYRKDKNYDFWNYVQYWLRYRLVSPLLSKENFEKIVKTLNNYELSQVYFSLKDKDRKKFVFDLISDDYKKYKEMI